MVESHNLTTKPSLWSWPWIQKSFHSSSWWCITTPSLVLEVLVVQKILSGQTFINILKFHWDLDLEHIHFSHMILKQMTMYHQTKFDCKRVSSSEDTAETVIFWLYKPLLWCWPWRQQTSFTTWHSDSRYYATTQSLVTKGWMVQEIMSRQTFFDTSNLWCNLDLEHSYQIFHRAFQLMTMYHQTKFGYI